MCQAFFSIVFSLLFQVLTCESQEVCRDQALCDAKINITSHRGFCICICHPSNVTLMCQSIQVDLNSNNDLSCLWRVNMETQSSSYINSQTHTSINLNASTISASNDDVVTVCQRKRNDSTYEIVAYVLFKGEKLSYTSNNIVTLPVHIAATYLGANLTLWGSMQGRS